MYQFIKSTRIPALQQAFQIGKATLLVAINDGKSNGMYTIALFP